jgi:hypothetical protein
VPPIKGANAFAAFVQRFGGENSALERTAGVHRQGLHGWEILNKVGVVTASVAKENGRRQIVRCVETTYWHTVC